MKSIVGVEFNNPEVCIKYADSTFACVCPSCNKERSQNRKKFIKKLMQESNNLSMSNKEIELASWEETVETYPSTTPKVAIAITLGSMLIAWIAIQVIFGADDFIYWLANLIG